MLRRMRKAQECCCNSNNDRVVSQFRYWLLQQNARACSSMLPFQVVVSERWATCGGGFNDITRTRTDMRENLPPAANQLVLHPAATTSGEAAYLSMTGPRNAKDHIVRLVPCQYLALLRLLLFTPRKARKAVTTARGESIINSPMIRALSRSRNPLVCGIYTYILRVDPS